MNIIAINSSAREKGNTAILINIMFKEFNKAGLKTEVIHLANKEIQPCKACFSCSNHKHCINQTDAFNMIFEKIKEADAIILGSPVYSANSSSKMQAFIERAAVICDMNQALLKYKIGAGIVVARRGGAINALDSIHHFFLNHEMIIVGSTYWNIAYGQLPEDVLKDTEGISTIQNLSKNIIFLLNHLKESTYETD